MRLSAIFSAIVVFLTNTAMAADGWHLNGTQGIMNFVVIDKGRERERDLYRLAIAELCAMKPICQVLFWPADAGAPKALPMSDAQADSQVAHWQFNDHTKLRRLLWSCKFFPETPKDECF